MAIAVVSFIGSQLLRYHEYSFKEGGLNRPIEVRQTKAAMVSLGWQAYALNSLIDGRLCQNWGISVSPEGFDVHLGHRLHVGGGDDAGAVGVGEVETVAECRGGE